MTYNNTIILFYVYVCMCVHINIYTLVLYICMYEGMYVCMYVCTMYVWCVHVCGHSHENTKIPQLDLFPNLAFLNTCTWYA